MTRPFLKPIVASCGPKLVHIARIETELPWRQQQAVADWLVPLIEATCEKAKATRGVTTSAIEFVLDPAGSYYFHSCELAGPTVTLGVSASHVAGATYIAFSDQAVAIDCCASQRAGEVLSGGRVAFSEEEFAMLVMERSLVDGWCAVECLCKLWGAGILQPSARPQLSSARPMTAESTEFASVPNFEQARPGREVCVLATKTSPTWTGGVVEPWEGSRTLGVPLRPDRAT